MNETYIEVKKLKKLENNTWTHQNKQEHDNTEKQEHNNPENASNAERVEKVQHPYVQRS